MNAKHLFLTLTMLLASFTFAWGTTPVTDHITCSGLESTYGLTDANEEVVLTNYSSTLRARYSGRLAYSNMEIFEEPNTIGFGGNTHKGYSTTSGGELQRVTVNGDGWESGMSIYVYAREEAFNGTENLSALTPVATITYPATTSADLSSGKYKHLIITGSVDAAFTDLGIVWLPEAEYAITMHAGYLGTKAEGAVKVSNGTSTATAAAGGGLLINAKAGDLITIQITPYTGKCLKSFTFGDMEFDLSCAGYLEQKKKGTFQVYMPAQPVTLTTVFDNMPKKQQNQLTFKENGSVITSTSVGSGVTKTIDFQLRYFNGTGSAGDTLYNGAVTCTSSNASAFSIEGVPVVDMSTGTGHVTIRGLAGGSSLNLIVHLANDIYVTEGEYYLPVTVVPREVALVAEADGHCYAAVNELISNHVTAQEVFKNGDKYLYDVISGASVEDMTWKIFMLNSSGSMVTIQNRENKYLATDGFNLKFQDASFTWNDNGDGQYMDGDEHVFIFQTSSSKFYSSKTATTGARDVVVETSFRPMTFSTAADAGIVDARTLTTGSKGTICVPFDVTDLSAAGADFYELTGKILTSDKSKLAGIQISEKLTTLVAGHSYFFEMQEGKSAITLTGANAFVTIADKSTDDGFVGCLPGDGEKIFVPSKTTEYAALDRTEGCYGLSGGVLRYVQPGATASAKQYRAYIDASELPEVKASETPRRRVILSSDYDESVEFGTDDPLQTGIDELVDAKFINWSEPVYNIMGVQVGNGATGVLIQNGQKFLVQ